MAGAYSTPKDCFDEDTLIQLIKDQIKTSRTKDTIK